MPMLVYLLLISSAACLVMGLFPSLIYAGGIVWGIALFLGGHYVSRANLMLIFGLNVLLYGLAGGSSLFHLLIFGMPSLIMGLQLSMQKSYYELQKRGMLSALLLVSLFMGLVYYNAGDAVNLQTEINTSLEETLQLYEANGLIELYEQQGLDRETIINSMKAMGQWLYMHMPALYYLQAILAVFLVLNLSAYIARKKKLGILNHKPFAEEIMPWQFAWFVIVALGLWLWGRDDLTRIHYVGSNLLVIAAPVVGYYGMACLAYLWRGLTPKLRPWVLIVFIINILVLPIAVVLFLCMLGLFDSLLDYRKLAHKKEDEK